MGVLQELSKEYIDIINRTKSLDLSKVQSDRTDSLNKVSRLQKKLIAERSAEVRCEQNINWYKSLDAIKEDMPGKEQRTDPVNAVKPSDFFNNPPPDARNNWSRYQIYRGFWKFQAELNSIRHRIKKINQRISIELRRAKDAREQIDYLRGGGPAEDIERLFQIENITKRNYSELYMLYELNQRYVELTTDENGERFYSSEDRMVDEMTRLQKLFVSIAEKNSYVISKEVNLNLNLDDAGASQNTKALEGVLDILRRMMTNDQVRKYGKQVQKYSNQIRANLSDQFVGKNVSRQLKSKSVPAPEFAMTNVTKSVHKVFGAISNALGVSVLRPLTFPTLTEALEKNYAKLIQKMNNNLPYCRDPSKTEAEKAKEDAKKQEQDIAIKTAADYALLHATTQDAEPESEVKLAFDSKMANVYRAIDSTDGKNVYGKLSLRIEEVDTIYYAENRYQVRILNLSFDVVDFIEEQNGNGAIKDPGTYINTLVEALNKANPAFRTGPAL